MGKATIYKTIEEATRLPDADPGGGPVWGQPVFGILHGGGLRMNTHSDNQIDILAKEIFDAIESNRVAYLAGLAARQTLRDKSREFVRTFGRDDNWPSTIKSGNRVLRIDPGWKRYGEKCEDALFCHWLEPGDEGYEETTED